MKKPVIFIFDPKTGKLISVCDVRNVTPDQFIDYSKEAEINTKAKLKEIDEKERIKEQNHKQDINELQVQIDGLKAVISYLLGSKELTEEEINHILSESEETPNE